ncbi:MAG: glyoxylate/hydroxypyruvate reductase A, partial [Myxococcales bacterium]|nr:glyoxylate/hydroxypyruvate reductase A [Myxococcales bacterium]
MAAQMIDYHLYAALHYQRDFDHYAEDQALRRWQPRSARARLRVGVLGLGVLGLAVARALVGLGFPVAGWTRTEASVSDDGVTRHVGAAGLEPFLRGCDLLICMLPHTPQTRGLLDAERLSWLPEGAALINAGRGSLVDEPALLTALDSGRLRGAFLDVCAVEPLPLEHPLWTHPKVRITPHIGAETLIEPAIEQVAANLERHARGEPLVGLVDRQLQY